MIKAVIFDMDGVLIDAREWHYDALNKALAILGMEISRADHLTTFDGLPTRKKLEMLSVTQGLPRQLHGFLNTLKQAYTMDLIQTRCRPSFPHQYALARLKAEGRTLGVASNSVRNSVVSMMEKAHLTEYLDALLSNEDVTVGKPDPAMYIEAMRRLDVVPEETLIVEDNEHGIQAAVASGAHLLAVRDPGDVTYRRITKRIAELEN